MTTFTKIGINVTTGTTRSPVMAQLGIYKDHKGVPGDLVVDAGEVDVTTIAAVEATISKTLFGCYWLAVFFESASSLQTTLQGRGVHECRRLWGGGAGRGRERTATSRDLWPAAKHISLCHVCEF